jgi:ABC-type ATPase involved in cell division
LDNRGIRMRRNLGTVYQDSRLIGGLIYTFATD